ncbi:MAG: type I 3-dehydroquinate dehydratase [Bacteroidetes bacterium]|jgi:3-dehydroquinate dehydratase type I|nr:type I 3-dehydroquinate dehydratase [Bacteroidota bacterium]
MICISISEPSVDACKALLKNVEMAEIRLDMCNFDSEEIEEVFTMPAKLVATHRPTSLPDKERMELLKLAIHYGAEYVDVEYEANPEYRNELVNYARKKGCNVIISYHNFEETPSEKVLQNIIDESFIFGADVAKVAVMANTQQDVAKILALYQYEGRLVAIGMGHKGKITRVMAPLLGAEFTFAVMDDGRSTAPGQLTFSKLENLLNQLSNL